MTEHDWNSCCDPQKMLEFLSDKASDRKGNLFVCAMCRLNWHLLYDDSSKRSVAVVERFVDGQATEQEYSHANYFAECPTFGYDFSPGIWRQWTQSGEIPPTVKKLVDMGVLTEENLQENESTVDPEIRARLHAAADLAYHAGCSKPLRHSCLLGNLTRLDGPSTSVLRCIFGPLSFRSVTLDSSWLTPTVVSLAHAIYTDRAFDRMPILADALEEAGCTDTAIMEHCWLGGEHVRGCWVVDLVLRKE